MFLPIYCRFAVDDICSKIDAALHKRSWNDAARSGKNARYFVLQSQRHVTRLSELFMRNCFPTCSYAKYSVDLSWPALATWALLLRSAVEPIKTSFVVKTPFQTGLNRWPHGSSALSAATANWIQIHFLFGFAAPQACAQRAFCVSHNCIAKAIMQRDFTIYFHETQTNKQAETIVAKRSVTQWHERKRTATTAVAGLDRQEPNSAVHSNYLGQQRRSRAVWRVARPLVDHKRNPPEGADEGVWNSKYWPLALSWGETFSTLSSSWK